MMSSFIYIMEYYTLLSLANDLSGLQKERAHTMPTYVELCIHIYTWMLLSDPVPHCGFCGRRTHMSRAIGTGVQNSNIAAADALRFLLFMYKRITLTAQI